MATKPTSLPASPVLLPTNSLRPSCTCLNQRSIRLSGCLVKTRFKLSRSDAEMSDASIKWCRQSTTAQQFLGQVEKFSAADVLLIHPVKNTALLLDVDGN